MKIFLKSFISFILFLILVTFGLLIFYTKKYSVNLKNIPAPQITNNYSLNDKLDFARNKYVDILSIGSSMSLNNLSSKIVIKNFKSESYLNLSAWGLNLQNILDLLIVSVKNHKPKTLIISSNIRDFGDYSGVQQQYKIDEIGDFIQSKYNLLFHLKHFNIEYYFDNYILVKSYKSSRSIYKSLKYDKYGAVEFASKRFMKSNELWKMDYISSNNIKMNINYQILERISFFCLKKHIKLFFFNSPTRKALINDKDQEVLDKHIKKVSKIVEGRNHFFVNSNGYDLNDSLFVDGIHLNSEGAKLVTENYFKQLKSNKKYVQFIKKWNK